MKMIQKTVKATLGLVLLCSAVFAQSLTDAKKAIDAEQYLKAKSILKNLIKAKPAEAVNYFYLGDLYLKDEYVDSAKFVFNQGIAADNEYALNYVGLGGIDLSNGNKAAAKANFEKAKTFVKKKDYSPYLFAGKYYTFFKEYEAALAYLDQAKLANPKDAEVAIAIGDAYRDRNNADKNDLSLAFKSYTEAYTLDNTMLRAKVESAVIIKRAQAWDEAIGKFNEIIAVNPNYGPAYRELAETYLLWGRVEPKDFNSKVSKALEYYKKYLDLTDKSLESQLRYADFLVYTKNWAEVRRVAQEMKLMPGVNPRVLRYLGYGAYEGKDFQQAEKDMNDFMSKADAKRILPQDHMFRGKARMENGKRREAMDDLKQAVEMDSTNAEDVSAVAQKLYTEGNYAEAAELYETSAMKNANAQKRAIDFYYKGLAYINQFRAKYEKDSVMTSRMQGFPLLVKADSAFSYLSRLAPSFVEALRQRAVVAGFMDDPKNSQGLAFPYWEKYTAAVAAKTDATETEKKNMMNAYKFSLAYPYYTKAGNTATPPAEKLPLLLKAKEYLDKVIAINPDEPFGASNKVKDLTDAVDKAIIASGGTLPAPAPGSASPTGSMVIPK